MPNCLNSHYTDFLRACATAIGQQYVLTDDFNLKIACVDWRKRYQGTALAVIRPANSDDVANIVRLCVQYGIAIVTQGGNTGLCGGATPLPIESDEYKPQIIISLQRLNRVLGVDIDNATVTVEAGCTLQEVQQAVAEVGLWFPLSLASEGTCTIGGNLSTNAGGTAVLRYGNTRDLCLGLEVVTPKGDVWCDLRGLRKNNTGYDLKHLFIGAEGTLGIITAATFKLFPIPRGQLTVLVGVSTITQAIQLLRYLQAHMGADLSGFEIMSVACMNLVAQYCSPGPSPFGDMPWPEITVLVQLDSGIEFPQLLDRMAEVLDAAQIENLTLQSIVLAHSAAQGQQFWAWREHIPLAQAAEGKNVKHDIALPISAIPDFLLSCNQRLTDEFPGIRLITFGHLGDGNLHYNVAPPLGISTALFLEQCEEEINTIVYEEVLLRNGSVSAEHGIGQLKREWLQSMKGATGLNMMRIIKQVLDPQHLFNPGKMI
jgi:FAD/FMN-containing dehydrogenase